MKIGLVSRFPPERCGIAIYSHNLAKNLKNLKCEVVKIGTKSSHADYKINLKSFMLKERLREIIKEERLDLIHFQYIAASEFYGGKKNLNLNFIRALKQDIPVVVTLHEVQQNKKGLRNFVLSFLQKQIIKRADYIIAHIPSQKSFLEKEYKTHNVGCIYMGVKLRKEHKRNNKNILFFGMINKGKGVKYLIKAMDSLKDCKLSIIGKIIDKRYEKNLLKLIKESKNNNIGFEFAWISEKLKEKYFRNADLVVFPYVWAPYQSAVISDAMSYGLPVVVTRTGVIWELVDLFKFGEVAKPKNPKAMADAIKTVFKNYDKYKKGISKYRKLANWSNIAKEHLKLYNAVSKQ